MENEKMNQVFSLFFKGCFLKATLAYPLKKESPFL